MKDFDELLDEVLQEDLEVEPRLGMERRVLTGMHAESSRKRWPRMWWVPVGACVGMALGVMLMTQHRPRSVDSRIDRVTDTGLHPDDAGKAAVVKDVPLHHEMKSGAARVAGRSSTLSTKRAEEVADARLPKMETFPAVAQSGVFLPEPMGGSGAKELREVVDSPQVAEALQSLKEKQERPLEVSAIEIQPL
jgi:hypothetical protein